MRKRPIFPLLSILTVTPVVLFLGACSGSPTSGKAEIQPGSPAYFWAAAKEAHSKGDFAKASDSLRQLTDTSNEYRERAEAWQMTITAGLCRGDMEWTDALREGAKVARAKQAEFRKAINAASADANQNALRYAEVAHAAMQRGLPPEIVLAFPLPALDASLSAAEAGKIAKGILPPQVELDTMRAQWQRRAVLRAIARASGNGENIEKAGAALASAESKVKADTWKLNAAREFTTLAEFYSPKKLDHAARAKIMLDEGKKALEGIPASAETRDLKKQLDALAKKLLKPTS